MKVLVISVFPPVDIADADHAYQVSRHLADQGVTVDVLTQRGAEVPAHPHLHLHPIMQDWSWREAPRALRCIRACAPDAVLLVYVGHLYRKQQMVTLLPTLVKRTRPQARFITQFEHWEGPMEFRSLAHRVAQRVVRLAFGRGAHQIYGTLGRDSDAVVVLSSAHLPHLVAADPGLEAKATLIPPPVLIRVTADDDGRVREQQRAALGFGPRETVLAYFGYIYKNKGLETLLAAFELVCRRRKDVRLLLIGGTVALTSNVDPGYGQRIRDAAAGLDAADRITFSGGFAPNDDTPSRLLRAADIAVLPFDFGVQLNNSSFGGVVAHGLPVVTTRGATTEGCFVDGDTAALCPPCDPERMAEAIEAVIGDAGLRHRLQQGAGRLCEEWFSWPGATQRLLRVLGDS